MYVYTVCTYIHAFILEVGRVADGFFSLMRLSPKYRYELALIYLKQSHYDLEKAIAAYMEDERWESEHPLKSSGGNKGKTALRSQGTPRWRAGVI